MTKRRTDTALARYASHTFACMAAMTQEMIAAKTEAQLAEGVRPGRNWFLKQTCVCGLREILQENGIGESLIGTADDT